MSGSPHDESLNFLIRPRTFKSLAKRKAHKTENDPEINQNSSILNHIGEKCDHPGQGFPGVLVNTIVHEDNLRDKGYVGREIQNTLFP
jgi:hypothetical protein